MIVAFSGGQAAAQERAEGNESTDSALEEQSQQRPSVEVMLQQLPLADAAEAARIDRELQFEWSRTGSPSMDLLLERGREAMEAGEYDLAIAHFTALIDHAPDFAEGYHMRATAYFSADLVGPALYDLKKSLTLNPDNYLVTFGMGVIFETLGLTTRAYEAYLNVEQVHPHQEGLRDALDRLEQQARGQTL